jgi:hypothetical protein
VREIEYQERQREARDLIRDTPEANGCGERGEPFMAERPFAHGLASIKASGRSGMALATVLGDLVSWL